MRDITEGITYKVEDDKFIFDFQANHENSIIEFNDLPLESVNLGLGAVYYFGYQFSDNDAATSQVRSKFFRALRYDTIKLSHADYHQFIMNALDKLHKQLNLFGFDVFVMPESRSRLNAEIVQLIGNFIPNHKFSKVTLIKNAPCNVKFNWEKWNAAVEAQEKLGNPLFVNQAAKQVAIKSINSLMDKIHDSDYFLIAETVKKNKYKTFIQDYLICHDKISVDIVNAKAIMLIDDVSTTGSTLFEALKAIRVLNQTAPVVIFTLVGKKNIGQLGI